MRQFITKVHTSTAAFRVKAGSGSIRTDEPTCHQEKYLLLLWKILWKGPFITHIRRSTEVRKYLEFPFGLKKDISRNGPLKKVKRYWMKYFRYRDHDDWEKRLSAQITESGS